VSAGRLIAAAEHLVKKPVWGCQMCGQCVLHSTGLTCPMNCPKTLRNGPCGGVRANGNCEVKPDMRCVWLEAVERSERLPLWRGHIDDLRPPVDNSLKGSSAWLNLFSGRDKQVPAGWAPTPTEPRHAIAAEPAAGASRLADVDP
jgi:hypothetical protein